MQKALKSSFRRKTSSKSDDESKTFIDVGVQTELTFRELTTRSLFDDNNEPKIAIILPPNYSVVFHSGHDKVTSQEHTIINSLTEENIDISVNVSDKTITTSELSHSNELEDNEVTSTSDNAFETSKCSVSTVRRSSSFLESPMVSRREENEIVFRTKKERFPRHHSVHVPSGRLPQAHLQKLEKGNRGINAITKLAGSEHEVNRTFSDEREHLLAEILLALKGQAQSSRIPLEDFNHHLQQVFEFPPERYQQILKLTMERKPLSFTLRLEKIAARKLKPRFSKGLTDAYALVYLKSSLNDVKTTPFICDTLSPEWDLSIYFELNCNSQVEHLEIEIYDHVQEESVKDRMTKVMDIKGASTLKKMKNAVQATVGNNTEDRLIGSTTVELKSCFEKTEWLELQKKDKPKKRGEVQLTYAKCTNVNVDTAMLECMKMTELLIFHELNDRNLKDFVFTGDFSENSREILRLHAQNGGLAANNVALCQWCAASVVHMKHRLSFSWFQELLAVIEPELRRTKTEHVTKFWNATVNVLSTMFCTIRKLRKMDRDEKTGLKSLKVVLNLMSRLANLELPKDIVLFPKGLYSFWVIAETPLTFDALLKQAIEIGAKNYFDEVTDDMDLVGINDEEKIQDFVLLIQLLQGDLQKADEFYNEIFAKQMGVQYSQILFEIYDGLLCELMQRPVQKACENLKSSTSSKSSTLATEDKPELNKSTLLFDLFLNLSQFLRKGQTLWSKDEPTLKLTNFQLWFRDCVMSWLQVSVSKAKDRIRKAIVLDTLVPIDEKVHHSSSAVDKMEILLQQKYLWIQLNWPQPDEAFSFLQKMIDDICNCCDVYVEKLFEKVQTMERPSDSLPTRQWCTATNNIQFICDNLSCLIKDFDLDKKAEPIEDHRQGSKTLESLIENKIENLEGKIHESFSQMAEEFAAIIGGQLLELAQDTHSGSDGVDVLMVFLEKALEVLHTGVVEKNFLVLFEILWRKISHTVEGIVTDGVEKLQRYSFFKNILTALKCMLQTFNASKTQLCLNTILKPTLFLLQKHGASTSELICTYYNERLMEQTKMTETPLGILTVSCYFKGPDLTINIMNAKKLPPMNSDGKTCDAYVKVSLLPEDVFPDMKKLKTKPKKKTLFPMFDETFVVPLSAAQKSDCNTIIHFKVNNCEIFGMTHHGHHIGDGFLSISEVEKSQSDGAIVKQRELGLSRVGSLDYDCINILERRQPLDKEAKEFLKNLKSKPHSPWLLKET